MFDSRKRKRLRLFLCTILLICFVTSGNLAIYALQSGNIQLEVKEPIEILEHPFELSLFPGETKEFNITIQNLAHVDYILSLDFTLNNTEYQSEYVAFSNETYAVNFGTQILTAWLAVSTDAPTGNFLLEVTITREGEQTNDPLVPSPSPSSIPLPYPSESSALTLLGAGARWVGKEGKSALFINSKDNWEAHHLTDGADWGPWSTFDEMEDWRIGIASALEQQGFEVAFAGDLPGTLSGYDLVVFEALWAIEPKHVPLVRDYLSNGGGVVVLGGAPCYFSVSCKDRWPYRFGGMDLTSFKDWFGAASYVNTGGSATVVFDYPFGTEISTSELLYFTESHSAAAVSSLEDDAKVVAKWNSSWGPLIFAFTHEFGEGRVYYQAHW